MSGGVTVRLVGQVTVADVPHDTASQRVLARTGSRRSGYAPRYLRIPGEWQDHALFQVLPEPGMR